MPSNQPRGPKQILAAAKWSIQGLRATFKHEASFRLEFYLFLILLPTSFYIAENSTQLWMLITSMLLVLSIEVVNSSIEAVVDMICGDKYHDLAKRAKDMGSAAVFIFQLLVVFTFSIVIYDNYFR